MEGQESEGMTGNSTYRKTELLLLAGRGLNAADTQLLA